MEDTREEFMRRLTDGWANPTPDRLAALLHPEGRLVQPLEPEIAGRDAARELWVRLFRAVPDLSGEVLSWARGAREDVLFVELRLSGTLGGARISWDLVDRITLRDGLAAERIAYFNPLDVVSQICRNPRGWPRWIRSGAGRPRLLRR